LPRLDINSLSDFREVGCTRKGTGTKLLRADYIIF
jgi:hypothetical protein